MVRRDGAAVRSERMQSMAKIVNHQLQKSENGTISLSKTIAFFQYEMGLTKEKVLEYLRVLADGEKIKLNEDKDEIEMMVKKKEDDNIADSSG